MAGRHRGSTVAVRGRIPRGGPNPRFEELATLINPRNGDLPAAHPFEVPSTVYWTATTLAGNTGPFTNFARALQPLVGALSVEKGAAAEHGWCVRGGAGIDDQ